MGIAEAQEWLSTNEESLRTSVLRGEYRVDAVRKVEIPKANGGKRMLGIPTVIDRTIQQAIHQKLSPLYDRHFSANSYGFRPGRNAHQAVRQASEYVSEGREWVVDIDLEKYFDTIPHERLKQCGRIYGVVKFLRSLGIAEHKCWYAAYYIRSWWRMTLNSAISKAMGIRWFEMQGLRSLRTVMSRYNNY